MNLQLAKFRDIQRDGIRMIGMKDADREWLLGAWQHCALFLFTCLVVFSRRPDAVLRPQFWAEDGRVFFEDAYNVGWSESLFRPYGGYFHAVPRLGAAVALLGPLFAAPLVLNAIAIALQALPVNLLLSRQSDVWGSFRYRSVMAGVYLALPNCKELYANITNSQCLLALSAFLILATSPRKSVVGGIFGAIFLMLFGLSGPYCILLLPIALFLAWKRHNRWQWTAAGIVTMTSLVQAWALLFWIRPAGPMSAWRQPIIVRSNFRRPGLSRDAGGR